jgi:hypothetical protein
MKLLLTTLLAIAFTHTNAQQTINLTYLDFNSVLGYNISNMVVVNQKTAAVNETCKCTGLLVAPVNIKNGVKDIIIDAKVYDGNKKIDVEIYLLQVDKNNAAAPVASATSKNANNQNGFEQIKFPVQVSVAFPAIQNNLYNYYIGLRPVNTKNGDVTNWVNGMYGLGINEVIVIYN